MHQYTLSDTQQTLGCFTGLCMAYLRAGSTSNKKQMADFVLAMQRMARDYKLVINHSLPITNQTLALLHQRTIINLNNFLTDRNTSVYEQLCATINQKMYFKLPNITLFANEQVVELILLLDFLFSLAHKHTPTGEKITLRLSLQKQLCVIRITFPKTVIGAADLETIDYFINRHLATIKINETKTQTGINLLLRSVAGAPH